MNVNIRCSRHLDTVLDRLPLALDYMHRVKWMMRQGMLSTTERARRLHSAASKLETNPVCTACQYAKQRRKTTLETVKKSVKEQAQALKTDDMFPGSCISVDHFEANPMTSNAAKDSGFESRATCLTMSIDDSS